MFGHHYFITFFFIAINKYIHFLLHDTVETSECIKLHIAPEHIYIHSFIKSGLQIRKYKQSVPLSCVAVQYK